MSKFSVGTIEKTEDNIKWFNREGYEMTGETLLEEREDGTCTNWVVFKGTWTRYQSVRDCGDHYILARYASYDRVDKGTLKLTRDVEDN